MKRIKEKSREQKRAELIEDILGIAGLIIWVWAVAFPWGS